MAYISFPIALKDFSMFNSDRISFSLFSTLDSESFETFFSFDVLFFMGLGLFFGFSNHLISLIILSDSGTIYSIDFSSNSLYSSGNDFSR